MPNYKILPSADPQSAHQEVVAPDAAAVFRIISHLDCREADVLADDGYAFSVRLAENGLWTIFDRGGNIRHGEIPYHG